ncbi:MAG: hypothetical protein WDN04_13125 [Rhodospirillales bacterium]
MDEAVGESPGSAHWFSEVETAHIAGGAEAVAWDDTADFVVVGYGGAGVAAAIEAAENGLSVLAIDRFHGGGATVMNGRRVLCGRRDAYSARSWRGGFTGRDVLLFTARGWRGGQRPHVVAVLRGEPGNAEWMMAHGVEFNARLFAGKTSYPTADYYLYHSDSSLAASARARAKPAARGHRAFMPASSSAVGYGVGLYDPLKRSAAGARCALDDEGSCATTGIGFFRARAGVKVLQIPPGTAEADEHDRLERKGTGRAAEGSTGVSGGRDLHCEG